MRRGKQGHSSPNNIRCSNWPQAEKTSGREPVGISSHLLILVPQKVSQFVSGERVEENGRR